MLVLSMTQVSKYLRSLNNRTPEPHHHIRIFRISKRFGRTRFNPALLITTASKYSHHLSNHFALLRTSSIPRLGFKHNQANSLSLHLDRHFGAGDIGINTGCNQNARTGIRQSVPPNNGDNLFSVHSLDTGLDQCAGCVRPVDDERQAALRV